MENFRSKLSEFGLFPENIIISDKIQRFPVDGKNKNGWYWYQQVGEDSHGSFGNWASNISETYSSFAPGKSEQEIKQIKADFERIKKESESLRKKEAEKVALKAQSMWSGLVEGNHPYLEKKKINANGSRRYKNSLVIPIFKNSKIVSLQFIDSSGKRFMSGGDVSGGAYIIKGTKKNIVLCEGFSTGATIFEATGFTTFVCFNAGNIPKVAKRVRELLPVSKIIIACDDDRHKKVNAGVVFGTQAAELIGGILIIPEFKDSSSKQSDFNDLFISEGVSVVKKQLTPSKGEIENHIREWCCKFNGSFTTSEIHSHFSVNDKDQKNDIDDILSDMCQENIIQQDIRKRSTFRVVDTDINILKFDENVIQTGVDIRLPFGLSNYLILEDRNIVVLAGDSNSGKTALMLEGMADNIMYSEQFSNPVYITSEMSQQEMTNRMRKIQSKDVWDQAELIDFSSNFQDVILAGRSDKLVYVDQLEVSTGISYAEMGVALKSIRDSLTTGVAIVAMQKTAGQRLARGGADTLTKARLYIGLHHCYKTNEGFLNMAIVEKCKMPREGCENIEGQRLFYHITKQGDIEEVTGWEFVTDLDGMLNRIKRKIPQAGNSPYEIKFKGKYKD